MLPIFVYHGLSKAAGTFERSNEHVGQPLCEGNWGCITVDCLLRSGLEVKTCTAAAGQYVAD